jgi:hypothetical protein
MDKLNELRLQIVDFFEGFSKVSADTIAWISIICIMASTVPGLLAVMAHATDRMPPLDITLMIWCGLLLYFIRSTILKDILMLVTIGLGFAIQAILLGLIFFT